MSITTVYSPTSNSVPPHEGADTGQLQFVDGGPASDPGFQTNYIGSRFNGTFDLPYQNFWRFELEIPFGSTVVGFKLDCFANDEALGPISMYGGWLKRQQNGKGWELDNGLASWVLDTDAALIDYNSLIGLLHDETVLWNEELGFPLTSLNNVADMTRWVVTEGTFTGGSAGDVDGLIAQLNSYLADDDNEATRGATETGKVAVCLTILRPYTGTRDQFQNLLSEGSLVPAWRPFLTLQYEEPAFTINSTGVGSSVLESRGVAKTALQSMEVGSAAIESRGVAKTVLQSRELGSAAIESRDVAKAALQSMEVSSAAIESRGVAETVLQSRELGSAVIESRGVAKAVLESKALGSAVLTSRGKTK